MKKHILSLVLVLTSLFSYSQGVYISITAGGNWNNANTWDADFDGIGGDGIPGATDIAVIIGDGAGGGTVNITSNVSVGDLYVVYNNNNVLSKGGFAFSSYTLTINGQLAGISEDLGSFIEPTTTVIENDTRLNIVFTNDNANTPNITAWGHTATLKNVSINPTSASTTVIFEDMAINASIISVDNGTIRVSSGYQIVDATSSSTITVASGNTLDIQGGVDGGSSATNFSTVVTEGTGIVTVNINGYLNSDIITLSSGGTLNVTNNQTNGWWHDASSGPASPNLDANSTVNYNRGTAQGVAARTYGNLVVSSGGATATKTLSASGTLTVQGNLSIGASTTFASSNTNIVTVQGTTTNDGIWTVAQPIQFNGGGTQIIDGTTGITFNDAVTFSNAMNIDTDVTFGSTVSAGSNNVSFAGDFTNNGTFNTTGAITFDGSTNQSIAGTTPATFNDVTINNTTSTVTINVAGSTVEGTVTLGSTGKLNANGNLTLVSNASGTASVATMPAGAAITGNITVQRYFDGGGDVWRNFGTSVNGATVDQIIAAGLTINGNDLASYDETVAGDVNLGWVLQSTFGNSISNSAGYSMWTRTEEMTPTINFTGSLNQGDQIIPLTYTNSGSPTDDGYNLVNNPFPSTIDWDLTTRNASVNGVIAVWNTSSSSYDYSSSLIASGQSFWVQTNGGGPTLTIPESAKSSSSASFLRTSERSVNNQLIVSLSQGDKIDKTYLRFRDDATDGFDTQLDGRKLSNGIFNLSTLNEAGDDLAVNSLPIVSCAKSVPIKISNIAEGNYDLTFDDMSSFTTAYDFTLSDNFLNTSTLVSEGGAYGFTVTSDPVSYGDTRFVIELSAQTIATDILHEIADACNFESSLTLTNAQVGVTYTLVKNGTNLVTKQASGSTLILPLTPEQVVEGLNQFDLDMSNGACGSAYVQNAIEFTVNPIEAGSVLYDVAVDCNLEPGLTLTNAQVGVTYTLIQNGVNLVTKQASDPTLILPLTRDQVVEGLNQFDLELSNGACGNASILNAIEFTINPLQAVTSTSDGQSCGSGQVLLSVTGATGNAYYRWYESLDAIEPIPDQNGNELLTPALETTKYYYVSVVNESGCESAERVKVVAEIVNLSQPDIQMEGDLLSTTAIAENYRWYKDGELILNENNQTIIVSESGAYNVEIISNNCSSVSENIIVEVLGLRELESLGIDIYPNPVENILNIGANKVKINSVLLFDTKGIEMFRSDGVIPAKIDMSNMKKGIYIINIATDDQMIYYRVKKK